MTETEGVIKFNLDYRAAPLQAFLQDTEVDELSAWRSILKNLGLVGETPERYDGYGFGNVSIRTSTGFVISGTQTGKLDQVTLDDYALCESWDLNKNAVTAIGQIRPSSESLSHASIYDVDPNVTCALHAHSPEIWHAARQLSIPVTDAQVAYGTPEMAQEVRRVIQDMPLPGAFSMGGHEDGVFTFGRSLSEAGELLVTLLAKARVLAMR